MTSAKLKEIAGGIFWVPFWLGQLFFRGLVSNKWVSPCPGVGVGRGRG